MLWRHVIALIALITCHCTATGLPDKPKNTPSFTLENDLFMLDGSPFQIISGAVHYFRIHPTYWRDRLVRLQSLGLNTIEIYVPWNFHEPRKGQYRWDGQASIEDFIDLAAELNFHVLLRAGPYICAEWDFGGLPNWLDNSMKPRSSDPLYLEHVNVWWNELLPRIAPRMHHRGGPILMVQIENEFGYCNGGFDIIYLHHLATLARHILGQETVLFTTDPSHLAAGGTIPGGEVLTAVDFGPGWFFPSVYFSIVKMLNPPGKSPLIDTEFYSGWLSHWGEPMANTSAVALAQDTEILLRWENNTGSLNFYMVHGGTNFGFWQGANIESDGRYEPHITSYDYHAILSEAGQTCQPGIGGDGCKFQLVRDVIANVTGKRLPDIVNEPVIHAYGSAALHPVGSLLSVAHDQGEDGINQTLHTRPNSVNSRFPLTMEEYNQYYGIIIYRTVLDRDLSVYGLSSLTSPAELDFGIAPHDYSTILINGQIAGTIERPGPTSLILDSSLFFTSSLNGTATIMDIIVTAMGRSNFGCNLPDGVFDRKGIQQKEVKLNGHVLKDWEVTNFPFEDISVVPPLPPEPSNANRRLSSAITSSLTLPDVSPIFYRGTLYIDGSMAEMITDAGGAVHLADTFLDTKGLTKGIAWVNGFNLGWYWPEIGPQMTLYVPGPVLQQGNNDVVLLELGNHQKTNMLFVQFTDTPDFWGPHGQSLIVENSWVGSVIDRVAAYYWIRAFIELTYHRLLQTLLYMHLLSPF